MIVIFSSAQIKLLLRCSLRGQSGGVIQDMIVILTICTNCGERQNMVVLFHDILSTCIYLRFQGISEKSG